MRTAQRACPICGNSQVEGLHSQRFELPEGHPMQEGYDVVACPRCGFVFADTSATQADFERFYAEFSKYENGKTSTGGGENAWDRRRLDHTAHQVADLLKNPDAKILDVGCANGGLLMALKELGYRSLCGLDPSPTCVQNTRRLEIEAHLGSLFQPFEAGPFDCILLSHTLEHVLDLGRALAFITGHLQKDGSAFLYVEVPDAARYKDYVFSPFQDFNTEHINHFSQICLGNIMGKAGFQRVHGGEKLLESAPGFPYPAIFTFGQYVPSFHGTLERDTTLRESIEAYINLSQELLHAMDLHLRKALAGLPRLIVWGTGQLALKLLVETCLGSARIIAFVDSNPINQGKILRGVEIVSPDAVRNLPDPIVITSTLNQQSITAQIHSMGLRNRLISLLD